MSDGPAKVHAMCGLVCSGKTTVARRLAEELPALRFSRDEWMLRLYPWSYDDPRYAAALPACTNLLWDVAVQAVSLGRSVVLDWNHWNRTLRREANERAAAAGVALTVHYVDVPLEVAIRQARARLSLGTADAHRIGAVAARHFATIFEPPDAAEGLQVVRHAPV